MNLTNALAFLIFILSELVVLSYGGQILSRKIQEIPEQAFVEELQKQAVVEELSTGTQIDSIPNDLLKSNIYGRINPQDLIRLSQSSKHFYQQTFEEREVWKVIYRACGEDIISSLNFWIDERLKNSIVPSLFLFEDPTEECVASWRPLCLLGYDVPVYPFKLQTLRPELTKSWPSCFRVKGFDFEITSYRSSVRIEEWERLMQWITPSEEPLLPSQKIRSLSIYNRVYASLTPEQENQLLAFLGNERSSLEFFTSSGLVYSTEFARQLAQLLRQQRGPAELRLSGHRYTDPPQSSEFLIPVLNALKMNRSLKKLVIWNSNLSGDSLRALGEMLSVNQGLDELTVCNCGIRDKELMALVRASLTHPRLKVLDLSENDISGKVERHLRRMVSKASRSLQLSVSPKPNRLWYLFYELFL